MSEMSMLANWHTCSVARQSLCRGPRSAAQGAHQLRHGHLEIDAEVVPVLRTGVHDDVRDDFHGEEALELQEEERHHHDGGDD
jgi:hypothetical protein